MLILEGALHVLAMKEQVMFSKKLFLNVDQNCVLLTLEQAVIMIVILMKTLC